MKWVVLTWLVGWGAVVTLLLLWWGIISLARWVGSLRHCRTCNARRW